MPRFLLPLPGALLGVAAASLLAFGCGDKKTETTPTPQTTQTPAPAGPIDWTISGTLVANPEAQPIGGASITLTGGSPVTSNAAGQFSISGAGTQPVGVRVSISASGYLRRDASIQAGANRSGLVIDLIRDSAPFSLTFYREIARSSLDGALRTTRRWHQDPSFYIQTIDENGADVPQFFVDSATSVITDIVADATAILYSRPDGNADLDADPTSWLFSVIR